MAWDETPGMGSLYCMDGKRWRRVFGETDVSNGIVWNRAGNMMYYTDSRRGNIYAYDFSPDGYVSGERILYHTDIGITDGMTIDENDNIWSAIWGGGKVVCIDHLTGEVREEIFVDAPHAASVAIGRGVLYITTARHLMSGEKLKEFPLSRRAFRDRG